MTDLPFRIHLAGHWSFAQVNIDYQPTEYKFPDVFSRRAEAFWSEILQQGQQRVFNGALCRLENYGAHNGHLQLSFSRTCYRDLLFSNAHTEELIAKLGEVGPVHALGISAVIETADGFLPIIRRSAHVGEGPGALDIIGGHIHPDEHFHGGAPDVFVAIKDEIHAELGVSLDLLGDCICIGLTENFRHRKPELVFLVRLPVTMEQVRQLAQHAPEADEYSELLAIRADQAKVEQFTAENGGNIASATLGCFELYMKEMNN
jgi:hypothetical protein